LAEEATEATERAMDNGGQNALLSTLEDWVGVLMRNVRLTQLLIMLGLLLVGLGAFAFAMRSRGERIQARTIMRCLPKDRSCCYREVDPADEPVNAAWYPEKRFKGRRVVVILEKARLELAQELVATGNSYNHSDFEELQIVHQALSTLLESPLNRAGHLLVYLHSAQGRLFEVHPAFQTPASLSRFAATIAELERRGEVSGHSGSKWPMMRFMEGTVKEVLPEGCRAYALTPDGRRTTIGDLARKDQKEIFSQMDTDGDGRVTREEFTAFMRTSPKATMSELVAFAIGASEGDATQEPGFGPEYTREKISICVWPIRTSDCCEMLCHEYRNLWGVTGPAPSLPPPQSSLS